MNGELFPVWFQSSSSSRRTAMAGRDEAFLTPLRSHTSAAVTAVVTVTSSPGRNHSRLSAGGERGCMRMFTAATAAVAAAAIQQNEAPFYCGDTVVDIENTTKLYDVLLDTSVYGGMDAPGHLFHIGK